MSLLEHPDIQDTQFSELHLERHQHVLQHVQASGADSLLELGCGSGTVLWQVLKLSQFRQATGVEHSGLSLAQVRDKLAEFDAMAVCDLYLALTKSVTASGHCDARDDRARAVR